MGADDDRTVFSIGPDGARLDGRKPTPRRSRREPATRGEALPEDGAVRIRREVKGRRGKPVTTVFGLPLDAAALRELASELKRRCGTGGSCKDGVIEIQGDHRDRIAADLVARGYRVKRAGG